MSHGNLPFSKLHGLGNDFVLLDAMDSESVVARALNARGLLPTKLVTFIADRKRGVGFDQLLVLRPCPKAGTTRSVHAILDIYNADGSMAEMCGNGLRAAALYLWKRGRVSDQIISVETAAGRRQARLLGSVADGYIETEMGVPKVQVLPAAIRSGVTFTKLRNKQKPVVVNVGNPHAVFFVTPPKSSAAATTEWLTANGSKVETHRAFPKRTNVEFVTVKSAHEVSAYVWERGVGLTEACGTGGVAVAVAAIKNGHCVSPVKVNFPGGTVEVSWNGVNTSAFLRGHATESFDGILRITK